MDLDELLYGSMLIVLQFSIFYGQSCEKKLVILIKQLHISKSYFSIFFLNWSGF